MIPDMDRLKKQLEEWNISLTDTQAEQFRKYAELLLERNKVMNLTAITDEEGVRVRHFLDSLAVYEALSRPPDRFKGKRIIDIGTGAGFPGVPIKIAFPDCRMVLADSLEKRVRFLDDVIGALPLSDTEAVHGRAEDLGRKEGLRDSFDLCVSRAVAHLSVLAEYALPFVKPGGMFAAYKTEEASDEIREAGNALRLLGGQIAEEVSLVLPGTDMRRKIVLIKKKTPTPKAYPRRAGTPSKKPL